MLPFFFDDILPPFTARKVSVLRSINKRPRQATGYCETTWLNATVAEILGKPPQLCHDYSLVDVFGKASLRNREPFFN